MTDFQDHLIQPIGSFLAVDKDGFFMNEAAWEKVVEPWRSIVNQTRDVYREIFGNHLRSVYVRGTVAQGRAVESISDIDTMAIIDVEPTDRQKNLLKKAREQLGTEAAFAAGVELEVHTQEELLDPGRNDQVRFIIKTQAALVEGHDFSQDLPKYRPDTPGLAEGLYANYPVVLQRSKDRLTNSQTPQEIQKWCRWAMKRLIRRAAAVMIPATGKYSRDLYPIYQLFSDRYLSKAAEMKQALIWAIEPNPQKEEVIALLDSLGPWLITEAKKQFVH